VEDLRTALSGRPGWEVVVTTARLLVDVSAGYDAVVLGADKLAQVLDPAWYADGRGTREAEAARDAALERGDAEIDLAFRVPPDVGPDTRRFGDLLDEVDRYCAEGEHLLSLVTPPGPLRFRRWYLGEFLRQVDGGPPQRWEPRDWPWPVPLPDVPGEGSG